MIISQNLVSDVNKENYDVDYQWQYSTDNIHWYNINKATEDKYTVSDSDFLKYIRVIIRSSNKYGNVEYPGAATSSASKTKCVIFGDTDLDNDINIDDATNIQKYLVSLKEFNSEQKMAADFDRNGEVSINDVTAIQKMLVQ